MSLDAKVSWAIGHTAADGSASAWTADWLRREIAKERAADAQKIEALEKQVRELSRPRGPYPGNQEDSDAYP